MITQREPSSYRDPDGYITYAGGEVYRHVTNDNAPVLLPAYQKFFEKAVQKGFLVPFEQSGADLKLQRLPVITYPYEWGFAQMKEAALLTLDIALLALEHGLSLKDATAFNVQQYKGRMIFIDHTSFEPSDGKLPWHAYSQFCRHFLGPLLVTSRTGRNANKAFLANLEGMGLDEVVAALPFSARFRPSTFIHIYLHNALVNKVKNTDKVQEIKNKRTGSQKNFLTYLRETVKGIKPPRYATEWGEYYTFTNYEDESFRAKEEAIKKIMAAKKYSCAWDMGGNNGHFSRIMAERVDLVVCMDIDYAAIDFNYRENRKAKIENIIPIVMDLTNPSPALGFGNSERTTIEERSRPDIVFALALIHHLGVTYNIPFPRMAAQFHSYGADVVVEYVDREDSQFVKLLRNKQDDYAHYNRAAFEKSFADLFDIAGQYDIPGARRTLYHFTPKK